MRACHNIRVRLPNPAWQALRVLGGESAARPHTACALSPYKSSPYKLLPPQNTTLVSLACAIHVNLISQPNPTPLYYFTRAFWPQFASLQGFLPSFLRLSSVIAFQFLFITSRCTATARILTTTQTSINPSNSADSKVFCKYLQLPSWQKRAFSRRIAVFCDRVTAGAARCCCDACHSCTPTFHQYRHWCFHYQSLCLCAIW